MDSTRKHFPHLNLLPTELRKMVYSMMLFAERARMARVSVEAMAYFRKHLTEVNRISVYATDHGGPPSIRINFDCCYEESYELDAEMAELFRNEFTSYSGCDCRWCGDSLEAEYYWRCDASRKPEPCQRCEKVEWKSFEDIFATAYLTKPVVMEIRTDPHGLIRHLQPQERVTSDDDALLMIRWHEKKSEPNYEDEPEIVAALQKWIEFSSADEVWFHSPEYGRYLPNGVYDIEEVRNASSLEIQCYSPLTATQLSALKGNTSICCCDLTLDERRPYYYSKIKRWIETSEDGEFNVMKRRQDDDPDTQENALASLVQDYINENPLPPHITMTTLPNGSIELKNSEKSKKLQTIYHRLSCTTLKEEDEEECKNHLISFSVSINKFIIY